MSSFQSAKSDYKGFLSVRQKGFSKLPGKTVRGNNSMQEWSMLNGDRLQT